MTSFQSPKVVFSIGVAIMLSACGGGTTVAQGGAAQGAPGPTETLGQVETKTGDSTLYFLRTNAAVAKTIQCPNTPTNCTKRFTLSDPTDTQLVTGTPNITERDTNSGAREGVTTARANMGDVYAFATADPRDVSLLGVEVGSYGGIYGRTSDAELPTTTTASFTGQYRGLAIENAGSINQQVDRAFIGDVNLDVDFGADSISGKITNRTFETLAESFISNSGDVTLQNGVLGADGQFSGNAFGGAIVGSGGLSGAGVFQGVIGGATGQKTAGLVAIQHKNVPGIGDIQEYGVFAADR